MVSSGSIRSSVTFSTIWLMSMRYNKPREPSEGAFRAILTFHSIDSSGSVLSYSARSFANLLNALQSSGIPIVDLDTLLRAETRYGVALTFDDGIRTVFTEALPILRKHCVPAHLFLTTNFVG